MPAAEVCLKRRIGDYLLEESDEFKLGEGAFGKVYRAEHAQSGIPVAVKKLAKEKTKFEELKAVGKLNNDNVIGIIDLRHDDEDGGDKEIDGRDYVFIILELCDLDLNAHLRSQENGRLNVFELDSVTECMARGYLALYERSIIHRDIKPENILLKYDCMGKVMSAKIGDFGASRLMESGDDDEQERRVLNSLAGTPLYMAPEIGANIVADRQYDAKVDMWSMGIVLFECITGQVPFDERALCRLFLFSANGNYDGYIGPPSPWPSSSPSKSYEALIDRLLELDVDERLSPREFHCWIVHQKLLIDETAAIKTDRHSKDGTLLKRGQFRLRADVIYCCTDKTGALVKRKSLEMKKKIENNNNNEDRRDQNGNVNGNSDYENTLPKATGVSEVKALMPMYGLSYALERCVWFSSMFVACNYCCFSMRNCNYGYES